jgi:hypothetical protein
MTVLHTRLRFNLAHFVQISKNFLQSMTDSYHQDNRTPPAETGSETDINNGEIGVPAVDTGV